jgi:hypothetical protein
MVPGGFASDGTRRSSAKSDCSCGVPNCIHQATPVLLAAVVVSAAQSQLADYALTTDDPLHCVVEAADLLDAAAQRLSEFSDAEKGGFA